MLGVDIALYMQGHWKHFDIGEAKLLAHKVHCKILVFHNDDAIY